MTPRCSAERQFRKSGSYPYVTAVISVAPSSGAGFTQTVTWTVSSPAGNANISQIFALFNTCVSGGNACYIYYERGSNRIYLRDITGTAWLGGYPVPSANTIISAQKCVTRESFASGL